MRLIRLFLHLFLISLFIVPSRAAKRRKGGARKLSFIEQHYTSTRLSCEEDAAIRPECKGTPSLLESCVLRCISEPCYQSEFAHDPLEDGEVASDRQTRFMSCAKQEMQRHMHATTRTEF